MEYKYTTSGKKVVIVGKLNSKETIVQEIFILEDGSEIPSGEQFIEKTLHDSPVISWEEKRTKEIKRRYDEAKSNHDRLHDSLQKKEQTVIASLRERIKQLSCLEKKIGPKSFKMISNFILNKNKYVVTDYDWNPKLEKFDINKLDNMWNNRFDGLKLVSLFGKSNGDLEFRIHRYSDGSGGYQAVHLFESLDEAKEFFLEAIKDKEYNSTIVEVLKKWGMPIDNDKMSQYKKKIIDSAKSNVKKCEEALIKAQERLNKYNDMELEK
jgi:hypothetical protein